ncbi:MFS transporter [uncultured Serinicoccus sp.]|uniref:MFS transporter n=1 Tax=uncultured Serinicoccus sp. TaxID=735514 RepID=UPI0026351BCE|nr:glycoside-pentoside-hexuronide (GPH):cation symporter [uncultured Serinicoccus sp.]
MTDTAAAPPRKVTRPFGWRDKIGYLFGDFGNDFTFILQAFFFLAFYTRVVGIDAAHVGTLLIAARLLDAFTDVGFGRFLDTRNTRGQEKFRPWILRGALPVAIASALMYMNFLAGWESYGARVAWMVATYLLWGSITYTMINIPYGSMASLISGDPDDRAQLSVFRSGGAILAALIISVAVPLIVNIEVDGNSVLSGERMMWVGIAMSVGAVICYVLCYLNVQERVTAAKDVEDARHMGFGQVIRSVLGNRSLSGLVVAALLLLVANLLPSGLVAFLWLDYFNAGSLQAVAGLAGLAPGLLLLYFAPLLARRFGKREASVVALVIGGGILILAYFLDLQGQPTLFIVLFALSQLSIAVFNFMIWAFIVDVIDDQEVRSGERDDATIYGIYSWARKLGQALAGGLAGWALGWVGYVSTTGTAQVQQSEGTLTGIYALSTLVPGLTLVAVALALQFLYPLSKKRVDANAAELRRRRIAAGVEATVTD